MLRRRFPLCARVVGWCCAAFVAALLERMDPFLSFVYDAGSFCAKLSLTLKEPLTSHNAVTRRAPSTLDVAAISDCLVCGENML